MGYAQVLMALQAAGIPHVVVGSLAARLQGASREPHDMDLVIDRSHAPAAMAVLQTQGFCPSLPLGLEDVSVMRFFDCEQAEIDVFAHFAIPFEELIARSCLADYEGLAVRVACPEDLARESGRPR